MLADRFARRYFLSRKSHAVINLIAGVSVVSVAVPVAAMIVLLSVFNGFESLVKSLDSRFDADLTVRPAEGSFFAAERIDTAALHRIEGVERTTLLLDENALIDYRGRQTIATVRGVDDAFAAVIPVETMIAAGTFRPRAGDSDRLIAGRGVAYALGLRFPAEGRVSLYALRRNSFSTLLPMNAYTRRDAPLEGIFALDAATDEKYVITSLRMARELFSRPGAATAALIGLTPGSDPRSTALKVSALLGPDFTVLTRDELNGAFYRIMRYEKWAIFFIALLILTIASFAIVGTLVMLILDKRDSFTTLRAMGADRRFIRSIFIREGYLIGAIGGVAGIALGIGLCLVQQRFGLIGIPADTFLVDRYPVEVRGTDLAAVILVLAAVVCGITQITVARSIRK